MPGAPGRPLHKGVKPLSSNDRYSTLHIGVIVLAVIGAIALLCVTGMALMHCTFMDGSIMSGMGR